MSWLPLIKQASSSQSSCALVALTVIFAIPGIGLIIAGGSGIFFGIILLGIAIACAIPSFKGRNGGQAVEQFLVEVDLVGGRDNVLKELDATSATPLFNGYDFRLHPYFTAFRAGPTAHIWKNGNVVWLYIEQKNVTHKTKYMGITMGKSQTVEFHINVHCRDQKTYSLPVASAADAQRMLALLSRYCPHAKIGYQ